jgi:biotin carboxyl carrier protein
MDDLNAFLEPGTLVRHPDCPDWGLGQVQSNISGRITVNFREVGKKVIEGSRVCLVPVFGGEE